MARQRTQGPQKRTPEDFVAVHEMVAEALRGQAKNVRMLTVKDRRGSRKVRFLFENKPFEVVIR